MRGEHCEDCWQLLRGLAWDCRLRFAAPGGHERRRLGVWGVEQRARCRGGLTRRGGAGEAEAGAEAAAGVAVEAEAEVEAVVAGSDGGILRGGRRS